MGEVGRRAVSPAQKKVDHVEPGADGSALEGGEEGAEASLGEEHLAEAQLAVTRARVCKAHVELHDEQGGDEEVVVGPESQVVHHPDAARRVADVDREPKLLDDEARRRREEEAFAREAGNDLVHGTLPVDDHAQPAEAGHEADLVRDSSQGPRSRIPHAEVSVAAEDEYLG